MHIISKRSNPFVYSLLAQIVAPVIAITLANSSYAIGATYSSDRIGDNVYFIMDGEIGEDEGQRFINELSRLVGISSPYTLVVNSPGGIVDEGISIANSVKRNNIEVMVPASSECASSCFLIFAAANKRTVWNNAKVGVHSAVSINRNTGQRYDDAYAKATTVRIARISYKYYSVPASVVGKMVVTNPDNMSWLDASDLALMGTTIIGGGSNSAPNTQTQQQYAPSSGYPNPSSDNTPNFQPYTNPNQISRKTINRWCSVNNPNALLNIRDSNFQILDTLDHGDRVYVRFVESRPTLWAWVLFEDFLGDTEGYVSARYISC